jgi:hypothetical protein
MRMIRGRTLSCGHVVAIIQRGRVVVVPFVVVVVVRRVPLGGSKGV